MCAGALMASAPPAAAAGFTAGAGRVEVTPAPYDPAFEHTEFKSCPPGLTGRRWFLDEEPYADTNGNGRFDYNPPEPYCDANRNGRYDGIYSSGGVDSLADRVHDPIDARAFALGDGSKTVVYVSVVAQGLFDNYTEKMRNEAIALSHTAGHTPIDDVVVSANHNESSPDTIGIYGGPDTGAGTGGHSGIDDYYMDFLQHRVAAAAVEAGDSMRPATLHVHQFVLPPSLKVALSLNFPTTDDKDKPAAVDPKVGLLQARGEDGKPIFTVMSMAAHNQEVGHSDTHGSDGHVDMSSDWPGYFAARVEDRGGGMGIFLVGDNGSEEDPITVPALAKNGADPYPQAQATGEALADALLAAVPDARPLRLGKIAFKRERFTVPLENNAFKAAAAAGLFGDRPTYAGGMQVPRGGPDLQTDVSVLQVGPDLQLMGNPGEAFPGLMLGTPFGIEDAPCPSRANPPVPTWNASAAYRFQVGLADDMIGYMSPPWAFTDVAGIYAAPPECQNDPQTDRDSKGHRHKLETEGVGPTAGGSVAERLTGVLKQLGADPTASMPAGRFVYADGAIGRNPQDAVGVWLAGSPGTLYALPGITGFGTRGVDGTARLMDYDGAEQPGSGDVTTRGALLYACDGSVARRVYLDLYPALTVDPPKLGAATHGSVQTGCGAGAGGPRGGPVVGPPPRLPVGCVDRAKPYSHVGAVRASRRRFSARGSARDRGCAGLRAVLVSVRAVHRGRCRFLAANGRLGRARSCARPLRLRTRGTRSWKLQLKVHLPRGSYRLQVRAVDRRGNMEPLVKRNIRQVRVR
ncbi:MAG: hypothetical protein QOC77_201 [Thermoleophilaceae bacterium]|nr:hypothetical protein [Thermoleophilaceae bacterium]